MAPVAQRSPQLDGNFSEAHLQDVFAVDAEHPGRSRTRGFHRQVLHAEGREPWVLSNDAPDFMKEPHFGNSPWATLSLKEEPDFRPGIHEIVERDDSRPSGVATGEMLAQRRSKGIAMFKGREGYKSYLVSSVSSTSPELFRSPFESSEHVRELLAEQYPEQVYLKPARRMENWRRQGYVDAETGQVRNQSVVSRASPDFMKSPFEANRSYFEAQNIHQVIKETPDENGQQRSAGLNHIKWKDEGVMATRNLGRRKNYETTLLRLSPNHPDYMHSEHSGYRLDTDTRSAASNLPSPGGYSDGSERPAGRAEHHKVNGIHMIKHGKKCDETGRVVGRSLGSVGAGPVWMDSVQETGLRSMEAKGLVHDQSERKWHTAGSVSGPQRDNGIKPYIRYDDGRVSNKFMQSTEAPEWMHSAYKANHSHFAEKQHAGLQAVTGTTKHPQHDHKLALAHGKMKEGRRAVVECPQTGLYSLGEKHCVSADSPDFMKSPLKFVVRSARQSDRRPSSARSVAKSARRCSEACLDATGSTRASSARDRRSSHSGSLGSRSARGLGTSGREPTQKRSEGNLRRSASHREKEKPRRN
eukprot:TRINITY_DN84841_c0_g1_i1.p1 TRINITY_DN84841_c0_g1~~TRINITY_DN84841_c0_g1_i1.p1  ORF type:complete len:622 (-),score=92.07 TRINITY_DN84841_c0_g1_i1:48-1799(-)